MNIQRCRCKSYLHQYRAADHQRTLSWSRPRRAQTRRSAPQVRRRRRTPPTGRAASPMTHCRDHPRRRCPLRRRCCPGNRTATSQLEISTDTNTASFPRDITSGGSNERLPHAVYIIHNDMEHARLKANEQ